MAAGAFAILSAGGCGGNPDGAPIAPDEAQRAVTTAFERPLVENVITGPEATTDRIVGSFTGGSAREHLVVVVFTRPEGTRALTGMDKARLGGRHPTTLIRVANVVVMYTRSADTVDRSAALRRSLRSAARSGPGGEAAAKRPARA